MQLCLLASPTLNDFDSGRLARSDGLKTIAEHAPLGILSLAAVLEQRGMVPTLLDLNRLHFDYCWPDHHHYRRLDFCSFALGQILPLPFDVIGLSTMCSTYPLTIRIAREVKRIRPGVTVVLGGPQASVVDVATLEAFPFVDLIVRGEAEVTFPRVLDALSGKGQLGSVPGITFRERGRIVRNPNAPVIQDLDLLPLPAFHLFPGMEQSSFIPLELGRGCPFACTFCSTNDFFRRRFRLKSPRRMIEQMSLLQRTYGVSRFDLIHDMFTVDRRKVADFCRALIEHGAEFTWSCSARTDFVDDELLDLMAEAGCRGIFFGVETGSVRMQRIIDKRLDLAEAARVIESTGRRGIPVTVSMIAGFPEERREDLKSSIDFLMDAARFDHVTAQLNMLAPLAETPVLAQYRSQLLLDGVFSDISHQGWRQDSGDRELIERHPDLFPNFYGLPSPLGREYVGELIDFVTNGLIRFRWLVVALHQESGDLLRIFDAWRAWRRQSLNPARYYSGVRFTTDFQRFLKSAYLKRMCPDSVSVAGLLEYQEALAAAAREQGAAEDQDFKAGSSPEVMTPDSVPQLAPGVRAMGVKADVRGIIACLRAGRPGEALPWKHHRLASKPHTLVSRPTGPGKADLIEVPGVSAQILKTCDGRRTVREIVQTFAARHSRVDGMAPEDICAYAMSLLAEDGLISFLRFPARPPKSGHDRG